MIVFDSITKRFGSHTAVDNVSFRVEKGDCFALLGPNGAGKTSLVRMLLGFSKPTNGTITLNGIPAAKTAARSAIGYLAENPRIPPHLSGLKYLRRSAAAAGLTGPQANREIDRVLTTCGMGSDAKKPAAGYSKGMGQRISLAAAILNRPEILILDEPVSGLDPIGIRDVRLIMEEMQQEGVTIILSSHLLSEVEKTCQTAAIIHKGKIMAEGAITQLVKDGETLEDAFVRALGGGRG